MSSPANAFLCDIFGCNPNFIFVDTDLNLNDLLDVNAPSPFNNQVIRFNSSILLWEAVDLNKIPDVNNADFLDGLDSTEFVRTNPVVGQVIAGDFDLNHLDGNTFFGQTFFTGQSDNEIVTIQEFPGMTQHVFSILDSDGVHLVTVLPNGQVDINRMAQANEEVALHIIVDAEGFANIVPLEIDYTSGALSAGGKNQTILIGIDKFDATGGQIIGLEMLTTQGDANVIGMEVGALISPIKQLSGSFVNMDSAFVAGVDRLAEFTSVGSDIAMFVNNDDNVTIGNATKFENIGFLLDTVASGPGIKPVFEISIGVGAFETFNPSDTTRGMRQTGIISFGSELIPNWVVGANNEFIIRITRTANSLNTVPVENLVQITDGTEFFWNEDGNIFVKNVDVLDNFFINGVDINSVFDNRYVTIATTQTVTGAKTFSEQLTVTHVPTGTTSTTSSLVIAPVSATANANLIFAGIGGSARFQVDEDGDITFTGSAITNQSPFSVISGDDLTLSGIQLLFSSSSSERMRLFQDRLTFENGTTDTALSWPTDGQLDFRVGATDELSLDATDFNVLTNDFNVGGTGTAIQWCVPDGNCFSSGKLVSEVDGNNNIWVTLATDQNIFAKKTFNDTIELSDITVDLILHGAEGGGGTAKTGSIIFKSGSNNEATIVYQDSDFSGNDFLEIKSPTIINIIADSGSGAINLDGVVTFGDDVEVGWGATNQNLRQIFMEYESASNFWVFERSTSGLGRTGIGYFFNKNLTPQMDFRIGGNNKDQLFCTDALNDRLGIGSCSPSEILDVNGNILMQIDGNTFFRDAQLGIGSSADGTLNITSDGSVDVNAILNVDQNVRVGLSTTNNSISINGANGGCLIIEDTDSSGFTFITALNGVLTASTTPC